jgi:hypothetical protein
MCQEAVRKMATDQFSGVAVDFYNTGIQKFITQYYKCLNLQGDYEEH